MADALREAKTMVDLMNEGIPGPDPGGQWSWSGILAYTVDMYGGVGGQMMAQGGITGMPSPGDGGTGSVIPGADGGSATPENRDNQLLSPNGLPVPRWTPHGSPNPNDISNLYATALRQIALGLANAPHQVNSGLWGVPGTGWTDKWPVPQQAKADKYQTMPPKHRVGPKVDPYFEIAPSIDWTNDFNILDNPYEYENWPFPDNQITPIGDVVTFPGNPANDNNPTGPGGGPHNWDSYRQQAALARAIAAQLQGNLGQDHFFGP